MSSSAIRVGDLRPAGSSAKSHLSDLSQAHARRGAAGLSQLAAWASDVHALEELLWENGLGDGPDPRSQLAAVGEAIAASVEARARSVSPDLSARQVVEIAREAMVATFDASVSELLADRLMSLDHLDDCGDAPRAGVGPERAAGRVRSGTVDDQVGALREAAADSLAVAEMLMAQGDLAGAQELAVQADAASFEAYLMAAADSAGDDGLVTVELRWELALALGLSAVGAGCSPAETALDRRRRLVGLVGSGEAAALALSFAPFSEG